MLAPLLLVATLSFFAPPSGAVDPTVTQATIHTTICRPGYATAHRPSSTWARTMKRRLLRQAGLPVRDSPAYELDHLVPIALGGCPACETNIWLQPWEGTDGAKAKDRLEMQAYRAVCANRIPLTPMQACFQVDWHSCLAVGTP